MEGSLFIHEEVRNESCSAGCSVLMNKGVCVTANAVIVTVHCNYLLSTFVQSMWTFDRTPRSNWSPDFNARYVLERGCMFGPLLRRTCGMIRRSKLTLKKGEIWENISSVHGDNEKSHLQSVGWFYVNTSGSYSWCPSQSEMPYEHVSEVMFPKLCSAETWGSAWWDEGFSVCILRTQMGSVVISVWEKLM
jgi:hypothetical protein